MKVTFYHSSKDWCLRLATLFAQGVRQYGDTVEFRLLSDPINKQADVLCLLGAGFKDTFLRMQHSNKLVCYLDKGWFRAKDFTTEGAFYHFSVGGYRPSHYAGRWGMPNDRRRSFDWEFKPWRLPTQTTHILMAWSSFKYHDFHDLPPPPEHAAQIIKEIRRYSKLPIIYRQKPNQPRYEVEGAVLSREGSPLSADLKGAHVLITVGSSACLEAMLAGVPSIILGDALLSPISSCLVENVNWPYLANNQQRTNILNDLAYCLWHESEYANGKAWAHMRPLIVEQLRRAEQTSHVTVNLETR